MRALLVSLLLAVAGLASPASAADAAQATVPQLKVQVLASGLGNPWDVKPLPDGALLITQRNRATLSLLENGTLRTLAGFPSASVWVSAETGLMGLAVDPDFATNRRIYTCQGGFTDSGHDVRVMAWTMNAQETSVTSAGELIGGFPTSTGRHAGCRLLIDTAGSLLISTGDAQQGTNPENLDSLGGKTLRIDRFSGAPWPGNPFVNATGLRRFVQTYGHRNVQGLAQRADGTLWSIEQGTYRDDEVNLLRNGGDYGYNPVPKYNESVPMTDQSLPGQQIYARWRSGDPTLATSGGTFVAGAQWGALDGTLAVACLKAQRVIFIGFDAAGLAKTVRTPPVLRQYGRIRQVSNDLNGDLLIATSNGSGTDKILRVSPVSS